MCNSIFTFAGRKPRSALKNAGFLFESMESAFSASRESDLEKSRTLGVEVPLFSAQLDGTKNAALRLISALQL